MNRRRGTSLLSVVVLSLTSGCASGPDTFATAAVSIPADAAFLPLEIAQPPYKAAAVAVSGIDHWSGNVHHALPEPVFEDRGFICGLVAMPLPAAGPWRLAGVTPVYYTPVLDIYAERRKIRPASEPVYYHFRLSKDAR